MRAERSLRVSHARARHADACDELAVRPGTPHQKAAVALLGDAFNQLSPDFGKGRDALVIGVTGYLQQFPNAALTFKRTVPGATS